MAKSPYEIPEEKLQYLEFYREGDLRTVKIGVDARELEFNPHGVGRVLRNILKVWGEDTRNHRFVLYFKNTIPETGFLDSPVFEKKIIPLPSLINRGRIWEQMYLPRFIDRDQVDVFFSPAYTIPLRTQCPTVVIVHDISYQTHPEWFPLRQGMLWRWLTRWSVQRTKKIICCSNFTKREILNEYGGNLAGKISTVYWAPQEHFKFADEDACKNLLASKYQINQPFFLFVGSLFKRRNIPLLIQSFRKIAQNHPEYLLILIGSDTAGFADEGQSLKTFLDQLDMRDKVRHYGYLEEKDLVAFYQEAFCLVYPTTYEGFGFPVVEAMACGVPVIIPNAQSVEEVSAGAAKIVDPLNEENLAQAMNGIIENQNVRQELIEKGLERVHKLNWRETAATILDLLEEAGDNQKK